MSGVQFQSLLGLSDIQADSISTNVLHANTVDIDTIKLTI